MKPENLLDLPVAITAGGVIVRFDKEWLVALTQALQYDEEYWFLPKGHAEGDESLEETARREIEEEVGLTDFTHWQFLGTKERASLNDKEWKTIHYFFGVTTQAELNPVATDKHHVAKWFPLFSDLPVCTDEQREIIEVARMLIKTI